MEEKINIPTKEEVSKFLDLNVENVNKVFLYATVDRNGKKLESSDFQKYKTVIKDATLLEEGSSDKTVYFNLDKLLGVRGAISGFFQQLQISFWNKGLRNDDPRYTKTAVKDLIGLKACDGKTNVIKLKNKAGREEFVSVWADQAHKDSIDQLLYMARGLEMIEPLKDSGAKDKSGNPILVVDTTHRIFEKMIPRYSEETKATLSKLIMAKAKKPTAPTAPSGQGEDGGMEK